MIKLASESMLTRDQLLRRPAHKLSKMIKHGRLTSTKLCEIYIERIKLVQPMVNAVCEDRFERALQEAAVIDQLVARYRASKVTEGAPSMLTTEERTLLESPLLGVPVSVKECIAVDGMILSCGLWVRRNVRAEEDAVVVKNVRRFGLIPICTTNVPEMTMYWADCRNKIYGRTCNPYDSSRISGASSGGEGALLGAGASIIGIGSDIGGSLRNPAQYCGIMSHKPSPFLVSAEGNFPAVKEARLRLFTMGPMCRYASDLRHLLRILIQDKDNPKQDSYFIHQPKDIGETRERVLRQLGEPFNLSGVKLFYATFKEVGCFNSFFGQREKRIEPEIMEQQQQIIDHFKSKLNCQADQIDLDKYLDQSYLAWTSMMFCGGTVDRDQAFEEREPEKIFGITSLRLEFIKLMFGLSKHTLESLMTIKFGLPMPKTRTEAYRVCEKYEKVASDLKKELEITLGDFGCIIIPTLPTVAHKHNFALMRSGEARVPLLWNVVQFPATHVSIRLDKVHGLPFGFTITSKPGNDALTIAVAEEIERAFGGWTPPSRL